MMVPLYFYPSKLDKSESAPAEDFSCNSAHMSIEKKNNNNNSDNKQVSPKTWAFF